MWKFGPTFKEDLAQNADMENGLFASINQAVRTLPPATAIDLVQSSLKLWAGTGKDERLWNRLLQAIGSTECPKQQSTAVLSAILVEAPKVPYPSCGPDGDLSGLALSLVESALTQGDIESAAVLGRLLVTPSHFIPTQTAQGFADRMSSVVTQTVPSLLRSQSTPLSLRGALRTLLPLFVAKSPLAQQSPAFSDVIVNVLVLSYILCLVEDGDDTLDDCIATAKSISKAWAQTSCPEAAKARQSFLNVVHATLQDVQARLEGPVLVDALSAPDLLTMFDVVTFDAESILPPITAFEELHSTSTIGYIDTPLALFDPAIKHSLSPVPYDKSGLSSYGRLLAAFLEIFKWDRHALMRHPQMIVYLLFVECAAEDFLLDSEERNPIFGSSANKPLVMSVREDVSMALAYFFSSAVSSISDSWHQRTCSALKTNSQVPDTGALSQIVTQTFRTALDTETRSPRDLRIFRKVASQVSKAGDISSQDADQWILLSESIRKQAPQTSLSITLTIAQAGVECMRLDRLRNELASSLSGVPPSRANTDGLRLLRHLVASAPLPDSEGVYLPPQRAVFLLQALQKWVASDEELDEEIDSLIVQVSSGLAPILLTIPGSHWDFVFDLMESNLEATSINDKGTYVCLSRTLNLISVVDDLASNNKTFRSTWMERRSLVLNAFSERLLEQQAQTHVSGIHQDLLLQLLVVGRRLRPSIEEEKGLERLLPLLHNPSPEIQVEVYHLLVPLVASRNERVVVEAAVENDQASPCELPHQLLEVLSPKIILDDEEDLLERGLAAFLPWFLVLEFFEDISIKVKNGYAESLTTSGLVVSRLVPILISSLDLKPPNKPFQIEMWAVDEFYLDLLDTSLPSRFRVLASHLLHRALTVIPSSIRLWFQDLKDRKLADAISLYTSRYFTPLITEQELSRLKEMGSSEEFSDENFSIKVHSGVREVSAIYTVDDQQMNIRAAFPPDYPLRSINVEGGQQLGIPSNKWKAWLLNVQMVANQGDKRYRSQSSQEAVPDV
ncbi:hypothetical protein FRB90_011876 [Tulasnella sp. 427]|nr:hypothetical protein FRB90_011876 [Tulasnella sp. 427]